MRIWVLASCGGLLALTACSSNQPNAHLPEEDDLPEGGSAQVNGDSQSTPGPLSSVTDPETITGRPRKIVDVPDPPLPAASLRRSVVASVGRGTRESLSVRLARIQTRSSSPRQKLPRSQRQNHGTVVQPNPLSENASGTSSVQDRRTGLDQATAEGHGQPRNAGAETVTSLSSPAEPQPAAPQTSNESVDTSDSPGAIALADIEPVSSRAKDLIQPSLAASTSQLASLPISGPSQQHLGRSGRLALSRPETSMMTVHGGPIPDRTASNQRLALRASRTVTPSAVRGDETPLALVERKPPADQNQSAERTRTTARVSNGDGANAHRSLESQQVSLNPAHETPNPHVSNGGSNSPLPQDITTTPRLHGNGSHPVDFLTQDPQPSVEQKPSPVQPLSPQADGTLEADPSPNPFESLPLHNSGPTSPGAIGEPEDPLTTTEERFSAPAEEPHDNHNQARAEAQPTHEAGTIPPLQVNLEERQNHGSAGESLSASQPVQPRPSSSCSPDSLRQDLLTQLMENQNSEKAAQVTAPELSAAVVAGPSFSKPLDSQSALSKAKPCPAGTKSLAQMIPDAATAGTPIPGRVESPTR